MATPWAANPLCAYLALLTRERFNLYCNCLQIFGRYDGLQGRQTDKHHVCTKCSIRPNAIREFFQSLNNLLWHIPISRSPQATRVICAVYLPSNPNSKNNWFSSIITLNLSFIKWIKYHYESKFICFQSWRSHFSFGITFSLWFE